jgi:uncharacterized membrane protein
MKNRGRRVAVISGAVVLLLAGAIGLQGERLLDLYHAYRTGYEFIWMPEGVVPGIRRQVTRRGLVAVDVRGSWPDRPISPDRDKEDAALFSLEERKVKRLGRIAGRDEPSQASAINEAGTVIGTTSARGGASHFAYGFIWTSDGGMVEIPNPGSAQIKPLDINQKGQVVGVFFTAHGLRPFLWETGKAAVKLDGLAEEGDSYADAINENGWIAGSSTAPDGVQHPVAWEAARTLLDLGLPQGALKGHASALNDRNEFLVSIEMGGPMSLSVPSKANRPFLWTRKNGYSALPLPSGYEEFGGTAINNRGQVLLGAIKEESGKRHEVGFLFQDGKLQELPAARKGIRTTYCGLNDGGWLVGFVTLKESNDDLPLRQGFVARPWR